MNDWSKTDLNEIMRKDEEDWTAFKADFPLGEFFRAKRSFSSTGMRSLIATGATVFAGSFLFEKVSSNSFYFFTAKKGASQ